MSNRYLLFAGIICLLTALLHTIGGQISLVNPLLISDLDLQVKTEWLGAWHMITILLWVFGYILVTNGLSFKDDHLPLIKCISLLCFLFSGSFIVASLFQGAHAIQYILFLPIAALSYQGVRKMESTLLVK